MKRSLLLIVALAVPVVPLPAQQAPAPPRSATTPATVEAQRERWNRVFSEPRANIRTEANQFVVQVARELKPGKALDIGMRFGRNAHLAAVALNERAPDGSRNGRETGSGCRSS